MQASFAQNVEDRPRNDGSLRIAAGQANFRQRERSDEPGLLALFSEESFLRFASARAPFASCDEMREWLDAITAPQRFEIVAEVDDQVAGFAGLYLMGDGFGHAGWIMMGVLEAAQRRGLGSSLLNIILATAHLFSGLRRVQLIVLCDNEPAIRLYRKFGFEIEGRHRAYACRGSEFIDAFTMARIFDVDTPQLNAGTLRQLGLA